MKAGRVEGKHGSVGVGIPFAHREVESNVRGSREVKKARRHSVVLHEGEPAEDRGRERRRRQVVVCHALELFKEAEFAACPVPSLATEGPVQGGFKMVLCAGDATIVVERRTDPAS